MTKYNAKNERIKKQYYEYLGESKGRSSDTIDQVRNALYRFEIYNKFKDLGSFNKQQAMGFKKHLAKQKNTKGNLLSASTMVHVTNHLKQFFTWLICQKGYRSKFSLTDIDYFNLLDGEKRIAKVKIDEDFPTIEQVRKVIFSMPTNNEVDKRNQALIAFTILTCARDGALATLKIKHVDIYKKKVTQDPKEVKTKRNKLIITPFAPIGEDIEQIVTSWINYLTKERLYGVNDPLFPRTKLGHDKNKSFKADGIEPEHWKTTSQIRKIFKDAFENAGMKYYNPHSFRDTLGLLAQQKCKNIEEYKAWSLSFGHSNILTSMWSYGGEMNSYRQVELVRGLDLQL